MSGLTPWIARGAAVALGVALVAGILWFVWAAGTVLVLVFVAVILGAGLQPLVSGLRATIHIGRGAAILLVYGVFLATVVALAFVVVPIAIQQLGAVVAAAPRFFEDARAWAATLQPPIVERTVTSVIDVAARALPSGNVVPEGEEVLEVGITVVGALMSVLTLLTVVYFWLTEHARLQRYALAFVPRHRRARARDVWNQAEARLGRWVRAQLILMATLGIGTGVAYTLLGVPAAILLALWSALAEAIPIIGPLLGAIPAVIFAATVSPQLALVVAGVYFVLQLIEGNVLVPIVMRNTVGISPFLVILSVLAGAAAGGFVGALLAVPIAATAEILLEGLQAREVPVAQDPTSAPDQEELEKDQAGATGPASGGDPATLGGL
ncbi:MAG TPA: AI-2E family transporter [Candidatus Limnocylindrales bacterium]|nr:AI-2E family transporter [Candidatus Limnocylindrales bacterium]